jgi:hypothetical protein
MKPDEKAKNGRITVGRMNMIQIMIITIKMMTDTCLGTSRNVFISSLESQARDQAPGTG